jgi:hypothetical protein
MKSFVAPLELTFQKKTLCAFVLNYEEMASFVESTL